MKMTTKLLKDIIKEEITKVQEYGYNVPPPQAPVEEPDDTLNINAKPDGGWILTGRFKGRKVHVDSRDSGESLLTKGPEQLRFALARTLLGYFFQQEGEDGLRVDEPMLRNVQVNRNGSPVRFKNKR